MTYTAGVIHISISSFQSRGFAYDGCDWVDSAMSVSRLRTFHTLQGIQNHQSKLTKLLVPHLQTFCTNSKENSWDPCIFQDYIYTAYET